MKFQELTKKVGWEKGWESIWKRMLVLYPDQVDLHDAYHKTFHRCKVAEPASTNMRIWIHTVEPDEIDLKFDPDSESYVEVSGKNGTRFCDDEQYITMPWYEKATEEEKEKEIVYGIEFTPWNEWLDMEIDRESLIEFSDIDIIVHALWEMTFISYDENEIGDTTDGLRQQVQDIEDGKIELIPMDEAMKDIEDFIKKKFREEDSESE